MKARFLISALILLLSIIVDQATKQWGLTLSTLHFNQGVIMGFYSGLPDSMRIVALGSFAGLIFFIYVIMMYLIPAQGRWLKYGLSFMVGGMFGNVIDKITYGHTVDFISFKIGSIHTFFNMADVFLWTGSVIVCFMIFRHDHLIWFPKGTRGSFLIWPREQFRLAMNFTLIVFATSIVLGIFSYSFFRTTLFAGIHDKEHVMVTYFMTYVLLTILFCLLTFVAGLIISHRSVGPLYAFEKYVNDLMEGNDRKLSLRDGDHYRDLEKVADKLREHLKKSD